MGSRCMIKSDVRTIPNKVINSKNKQTKNENHLPVHYGPESSKLKCSVLCLLTQKKPQL